MSEIAAYLITALLYGALAIFAWRAQPLGSGDAARGALPRARWGSALLGMTIALHALLLYRAIFTPAGLNLGLSNAISLMGWLTVTIFWLSSFYTDLRGMHSVILPIVAALVMLPLWLPLHRVLPYGSMTAFKLHWAISMLASALLAIGALQALLMAALDRRLHHAALTSFWRSLPPLMTMEKLLFRILGAGFICLTLTVLSGVFFSEELFGRGFKLTHHNVFTLLAWLVFAALLAGRWRYGWRGRTAVRWTLAGFVLLLLAYLGSKIVLEVILHRA